MKAIIFDFDGLIVDTETIWFQAFQEVVREYGGDLPLEEFAKCIGTTDEVLYTYIEQQLKENFHKEVLEEKVSIMHREKMKMPVARDGVKEYLEEAKSLNLKIGLASSSSREWVVGFLQDLGIREYFEVIKTKEDVEKVKPDPALYKAAILELGIESSEAVVFEDSVNGAKAAIAAGLKCVIVPNDVTKALVFENHHLRLESMKEKSLKEVLQHIMAL
ncbi:HAD family hydrolase [Bacillus sp. DX1.1]|uniref:HAD family hydrolase n=1 Tax=unclassified Bacillus (in: firmicutes) TaxID=185979 RepID=UPI00257026DB|nr:MULTISPECIES: HAD family hydrolase [unclassified Bacillus (in: firmicutes)]MDM5156403.1 HAD family hydrolase [Bacillus sp. DX1.1]MDM5189925.1 HAD family hydrolase [Bacillus sp. DX4.1]WJE80674.1 HAD family hydrolase [Bacillus sp. DX3.1]